MALEHLEETVVRIDERSKRNEGRIKALEESQEALHKLATSVELIAESQKRIEADVGTLTGKVDNLENQDGKKWRAAIIKAVEVLIAALVGFALAKIGLQ